MEYKNKRQLLSARFDGYVDLELEGVPGKSLPVLLSGFPDFVNIQNQKYEQILDSWFTCDIPGKFEKGDIVYFSAKIELQDIKPSNHDEFSGGDKSAWLEGYTSEDENDE